MATSQLLFLLLSKTSPDAHGTDLCQEEDVATLPAIWMALHISVPKHRQATALSCIPTACDMHSLHPYRVISWWSLPQHQYLHTIHHCTTFFLFPTMLSSHASDGNQQQIKEGGKIAFFPSHFHNKSPYMFTLLFQIPSLLKQITERSSVSLQKLTGQGSHPAAEIP